MYTKQTQTANAIRYLTQADSLSFVTNDIPPQTDIKRQLGIVYREAGNEQKSAVYFRAAMEGFLRLKDYRRYSNTAVSLSILYRNMKLYDSCLAMLRKCIVPVKEKGASLMNWP